MFGPITTFAFKEIKKTENNYKFIIMGHPLDNRLILIQINLNNTKQL